MKKNHTVIRLGDVWKIYRMGNTDVNALSGMNLEVRDGEFIAIMGPSGSGKSTAMNLVGCLDLPSKGSIWLEKQNIAHLRESKLAQIRGKKIGFVFQKFNLIGTLTAVENVMLPMIFQGASSEKRRKQAIELLKKVGLGDRINHKPSELSGGQQQRVAIARALANDPEVILADEPTGNLDSKSGEVVINFLKELNKKEKKTIILVTHDPNIAAHADKIYELKDGKIIGVKKKRGL